MAQILVRNLKQETIDQLKERAQRNQRSLEAEVRQVLEEAAHRMSRDELLARIDAIAKLNGPQTTDSVDLIREDRER
jgi:plasmid stability protein